MTFYVENETNHAFSFSVQEISEKVAAGVLKLEDCPYEAAVNLLLTDNEDIRTYNREYRNIDRETDVLSFPNVDYEIAGDFSAVEKSKAECFDLDNDELILGDIIISVDKVKEQAQEYGHSELREFAFLVAHSMLHLCGYDHITDEEAEVMERKQEAVLSELGIVRK
ncbi:MAG: rRNA maturation RNase YbeY [Lachnospiraceae bacterium]|nr:rRNA maturation RNase YbeY [Lachnospiraceae bacterium]